MTIDRLYVAREHTIQAKCTALLATIARISRLHPTLAAPLAEVAQAIVALQSPTGPFDTPGGVTA